MFGDDPVISEEDEIIVMEPPWAHRSSLKQNGCTAAAAAIKQTEETVHLRGGLYEPTLCGSKIFSKTSTRPTSSRGPSWAMGL